MKKEKIKITKEVNFDCAHFLPCHTGLCQNLHGHNYRVQATVEGSLDDSQMVIDFANLKAALNELVTPFDHALLLPKCLNYPEEQDLYKWAVDHNKKFFLLPAKYTTVEALAMYLKNNLQRILNTHNVITIRIWESPTSYAEVCDE